MMDSNEKVSVIICAYSMERLRDIHEAVDSVLSQTVKSHEVIIAIDHNKELFHRLESELPPEAKLVLNEGAHGLSETRNVGIRYSSGEIVAFMDDDAVAEHNWLENLIPPFENSKTMAVGGRIIPQWLDCKRPKWFAEELDWIVGCNYRGRTVKGNEIRNVQGGNMAFRKVVFEPVGSFCTEVGRIGKLQGVGEEAEICLRIKHSIPEALILYEHKAIIYHKVPLWRVRLKYLVLRSYNEGFYKSIIKKLSSSISRKPLSTERAYLRYLLLTAIPQRLRRFYKPWALAEAGAIMISIAAAGMGYVTGRVKGVR